MSVSDRMDNTAAALIQQRLAASVHDSLQLLMYDNARFLCERLVAMCSAEQNLYLLALCYYHCNQAYRSYHLLKGQRGPGSRYLFALSCMQLGKVNEARDALCRPGGQVPNGAAGHYLLGKASRLLGRLGDAKEHCMQALRLDPLLWSAYDELCALGADDQAAEVCTSAQAAFAAAKAAAAAAAAAPSGTDAAPTPAPPSGAAASTPWPGPGGPSAARQPGATESTPGMFAFGGPGFGASGHGQGQGPNESHLSNGAMCGYSSAAMALFPEWQTPMGPGAGTGPTGLGCGFGQALGSGFMTPAAPGALAAPAGAALTRGAGARHLQQAGRQELSHDAGPHGHSDADAAHAYETPMAIGAPTRAPAPPHKDEAGAFGRRQAQHAQQAGPSGTAEGEASTHRGGRGAGGGAGGGASRLLEDGKVRKVSGRLFQEPSRRSTRLAAKDGSETGGAALAGGGGTLRGSGGSSSSGAGTGNKSSPKLAKPSVPGGAGGAGGASVSAGNMAGANSAGNAGGGVFGSGAATQSHHPTYHECQNLPDPAHPPVPPSAITSQLQAYVDAKLRGGTPSTVGGGGGGGGGAEADALAGRLPVRMMLGVMAAGLTAGAGGGGTGGGTGSGNGAAAAQQQPGQQEQARHGAAAAALVLSLTQGLLLPLFEGCRHLSAYRCKEALQALSRLPLSQYNTAWVLCRVGRAHFERTDYVAAAAAFEQARGHDRYCLESMDLYSTALWHLRRGVELSYLAQEVLAIDRLAPQAWCVLGNLCSLQKEQESAIQLFQRAIQLDPTFAYAYTLAGHEYCSGENYDKALSCYRTAVRLDPRHYNALFGVGQIYLRQEKYDMAMTHFKSAASINPGSSVLQCYVGMTFKHQQRYDQALAKLNEAIALDPKNPLARYEKSNVLQEMDPQEALKELQQLSQMWPGEPTVYFTMGKVYKRLGDLGRAQQQLELALSFKNSSADANMIKAAIEKLGVSEDQEDDEL